eukprot:jgi/Chrzof1/8401/Cz03g09090.t1
MRTSEAGPIYRAVSSVVCLISLRLAKLFVSLGAFGHRYCPSQTCSADTVFLEPMGTDNRVPPSSVAVGVFTFLGTVSFAVLSLVLLLNWVLCYYAWCSKSRMRLGCPLWQLHLKM